MTFPSIEVVGDFADALLSAFLRPRPKAYALGPGKIEVIPAS